MAILPDPPLPDKKYQITLFTPPLVRSWIATHYYKVEGAYRFTDSKTGRQIEITGTVMIEDIPLNDDE